MTLADLTPESVATLSRDEKNECCEQLLGWERPFSQEASDFCSDLNLAAKLPEAVVRWTGITNLALRVHVVFGDTRAYYARLCEEPRAQMPCASRAEAEVDAALMAVAVYGRK